MNRTERGSAPLGLPSTIIDTLSGIPGKTRSRLGDLDAAVQQKADLRCHQITLRRGKIFQTTDAHHAVDTVDVVLDCALSVAGPLLHDRRQATDYHTAN